MKSLILPFIALLMTTPVLASTPTHYQCIGHGGPLEGQKMGLELMGRLSAVLNNPQGDPAKLDLFKDRGTRGVIFKYYPGYYFFVPNSMLDEVHPAAAGTVPVGQSSRTTLGQSLHCELSVR